PQISKLNLQIRFVGVLHFQNQTCYNQICGSFYRFRLYKFLNSHLFVIQLGMSSHISESNCKILNL
ncbi:hypothetical protein IQ65_13620, partial [Leptospira interrogans serovar Lai]